MFNWLYVETKTFWYSRQIKYIIKIIFLCSFLILQFGNEKIE